VMGISWIQGIVEAHDGTFYRPRPDGETELGAVVIGFTESPSPGATSSSGLLRERHWG